MRWNEFGQPIGDPVERVGEPDAAWTPCRRPVPDVLPGRYVRLERLTPDHAPALFAHLGGPGRERLWTYLSSGPFATEGELTAYLASLIADPGFVPFAIVEAGVKVGTGKAVGLASYLRIVPEVGTIEVGAIVYGGSLARTTGATEAMYLLACHAIDELGYRRYEWKCDSLNEPSRRAAHRLGFTFEGVWRQATIYKGRTRDTAWFGLTDGDWRRLRPAYERWLDPSHQVGGRQRESLSELTARALLTRPDSTNIHQHPQHPPTPTNTEVGRPIT